jgi:DNA-binding NtrC family response regulator
VLLEGETGSGKELAARGLHAAGARAKAPFLVLDCTAIPAQLAESVLFGQDGGTNASARAKDDGTFSAVSERRAGIFEGASGGTVFFDDIGELPFDLQPKVLRVLERREVVPVGATAARPVDVRVVSATRRDLRTMVNCGRFREDLYDRVAQARVRIPSLAERTDDVKPLVQHFLSRIPWRMKAARAIDGAALEAIAERSFPGNVRELKAAVERAAMLAEGATITADDIAFERLLTVEHARGQGAEVPAPEPPDGGHVATEPPLGRFKEAKRTLIDEFEKAYLARLLARAGTNISRAASLAGIERQSLRDLLRRHGLRGEE